MLYCMGTRVAHGLYDAIGSGEEEEIIMGNEKKKIV